MRKKVRVFYEEVTEGAVVTQLSHFGKGGFVEMKLGAPAALS